MKFKSLFLLFLFFSIQNLAQRALPKPDWKAVAYKHALKSFDEFGQLLSIPNDAHYPQDIEKNVAWCEDAFKRRGFTNQRLSTPGAPLLLATRKVKNPRKTLLIYLQIDGQPVNPDQWEQENPWKPTLKARNKEGKWEAIPYERLYTAPDPDWRIFARSASDAKGPAAAFLASLDALAELGVVPDFDMKVIMDFEEEMGSPNITGAVTRFKKELDADWLIILDGPRHVSNEPTIKFGARGMCTITITTFGPRVPVHSGNYGNFTPNPALRLANLLAGMKDDDGRVTLPGFYDGTDLTDEERRILKQVPDNEDEIKAFLGIAAPDKVGGNFQESLQYPSLNIRGLESLFIGDKVRTLIPAKAVAELDIRLVPSSDPERLIGIVRDYVKSRGYHLTDGEPTEEERKKYPRLAAFSSSIHYKAFSTPFDSECGVWLSRAYVRTFGKEPIKVRTAGGSIPISPFVTTLGIPAVTVSTVNADNNQHAENENIRVGNYIDAVRTFVAFLTEKI